MAEGLKFVLEWHFLSKGEITPEVSKILLAGERVLGVYRTIRDLAVFTDKRLIIRDAQGLTGKKVEEYSVPWSTVNMWSSENAGRLDIDSEIELWTRAGRFKIALNRKVDVREVDRLIASAVLGMGVPQPQKGDNSSYEAMKARLMGKR